MAALVGRRGRRPPAWEHPCRARARPPWTRRASSRPEPGATVRGQAPGTQRCGLGAGCCRQGRPPRRSQPLAGGCRRMWRCRRRSSCSRRGTGSRRAVSSRAYSSIALSSVWRAQRRRGGSTGARRLASTSSRATRMSPASPIRIDGVVGVRAPVSLSMVGRPRLCRGPGCCLQGPPFRGERQRLTRAIPPRDRRAHAGRGATSPAYPPLRPTGARPARARTVRRPAPARSTSMRNSQTAAPPAHPRGVLAGARS
jgi:hypothetical protein